jgi:uncharacterized protein (TIGR02466 family)
MSTATQIREPQIEADDLKLLWATPLLVRRLSGADDLNFVLEDGILNLQSEDEGVRRSNYGGWQSSGNLFEYEHPALEALHGLCAQAVADCVAQAGSASPSEIAVSLFGWANVLETGGYHTYHHHPDCHLSGIYYVRTGTPDGANPKSGTVCFYEPRAGGSVPRVPYLGFGEDFDLAPAEGMLVIFPSYIGHAAHPFTGAGQRITVAFNALIGD